MFLGSFKYSIDNKGRIAIPAKLRRNVATDANETFVITRGIDKCIELHPKDKWNENVESRLVNFSNFDKKESAFLRIYLQMAAEEKLDVQQRLMIPQNLIDYAGINKDVMIIGVLKHIEVWNPETYENYLKSQEQSFEEIAKEVMKKD